MPISIPMERIVRPSVFPSVRPSVAKPVVLDDTDRDIITLTGGSVLTANLSNSATYSFSRTFETEKKRKFDVMRVKNPEDEDQYVDIEAITRLQTKNGGLTRSLKLKKPEATEHIDILEEDKEREGEKEKCSAAGHVVDDG